MGGVGQVEGGVMRDKGGRGGKGEGDHRVVITPHLPCPPYWGRIILDAQGHPPLAEG